MRQVLAALPLLFLASAALAGGKWVTFTDPGGAFTVKMPSAPVTTTDSVSNQDGPVAMLDYTVDRGDNAMIVIVSDLTRYPNADPVAVINGAVGGAEKSAASKPTDKPVTIDRQKGRDVHLVDAQGNHIEDQVFFVHGRLYQVMDVVPAKPKKSVTADMRRYMKSFHFTIH